MAHPAIRRATLACVVALLPLALLAPAPAAAAEPRPRCSMDVFRTWRGERDVALLGTALADTMRAGAGDMDFEVGRGADRDAVGRAMHGRLVAVEALDRRTRAMLPSGVERVLLVPWGYDTTCRTMAGDGGSVSWWARPGTRGLFLGQLRDRALWAGEVPTIDVVMPFDLPYAGRKRWSVDTAPVLTPAELLGLYDAVRGADDLAGARTATRAWVRAHPDLARRHPATSVVYAMREPGEAARFTNATSPIVGTWRLSASLDGGAPRIGWLRTWDRTSSATTAPPTPAEVEADPLAPPHVIGYHVAAIGDTTPTALPTAGWAFELPRRGYVRVAVPDERAPPDAAAWAGALEDEVVGHAFAGDTAIAAFLRAAWDESVARIRRAGARELPAPSTPGRVTRDADGTLRIEQRTTLADGRTLLIRGVRVSDVAIRDTSPVR